MGGSVSRNVVDATVSAITKTSSNILNNQKVTTDQSQMIHVSKTKGNVIISGNRFDQKVNLNMNSLLQAMSTSEVKQKMAVEMAQAAKSIVKGINLFQFSDAENEMRTAINETIDISTNVSQLCKAGISQTQSINVDTTDGDVRVSDNTMSQLGDIFTNCVQNAVTNNKAIQDLDAKFSQTAVAKSIGISMWAIAIILAIIVLVMMSSAILPELLILKYLWYFMFIAGIVMIILAFVFVDKSPKMYGVLFSTFIRNNPNCNGQMLNQSTAYTTSGLAQKSCEKSKDCQAFDWQGIIINQNDPRKYTLVDPPQTTFYSSVSESPCHDVVKSNDKYDMLREPDILLSSESTKPTFDTIRIDPKTSEWYTWIVYSNGDNPSSEWKKEGKLLDSYGSKNSIIMSSDMPGPNADKNTVFVHYDTGVLTTWINSDKKWKSNDYDTIGMIAVPPERINASGFKTKNNEKFNPTFLGIGVGLAVGGLFGIIIEQAKDKKDSKGNVKNKSTKPLFPGNKVAPKPANVK